MTVVPSMALEIAWQPLLSAATPLARVSVERAFPTACSTNGHAARLVQIDKYTQQPTQAIVRRQDGGLTVTQTVYVTLTPGDGQTASAGQIVYGSAASGVVTITVFVTEGPASSSTSIATQYTTLSESSSSSSSTVFATSTSFEAEETTLQATQTSYEPAATYAPATGASVGSSPTSDDWGGTCAAGDARERQSGAFPITEEARNTLIAIGIIAVATLVAWNFLFLRTLLFPAKLLVVAWHEFGHAAVAVLSGATLETIVLEPSIGGLITVAGGAYPVAALPAGFISSIVIGGAFVFAGFDCLASKIASFFLGLSILAVAWWANGFLAKSITLLALGLMIGLWFPDHARYLRYLILTIGEISSLYVVWDTVDDLVFRKPNPCCARIFNMAIPRTPTHVFAVIWLAVSLAFLILIILAGLAAFPQTEHAMFCSCSSFLPT